MVAGAVGLVALAWLVVGGWLAAALEAEGARIVARDEEVVALGTSGVSPAAAMATSSGRVAARILAARLIASVPLALVLALGSIRLVLVTYRELTSPLDVSTPLALRVLRGAPEVVVAVVVAWMLAEIVGAMAARRIALGGDGVGEALAGAVSGLVRAPALVPRPLRDPDARPAGDPRAGGRRGQLGVGGGRDGPGRCGGAAPVASDGRRVRRPVGRGTGPRRGRLRLASGHLDRRRGHSRRGRSGGPPTADRVTGGSTRSSATLWLGRSLGRSRRRGEP